MKEYVTTKLFSGGIFPFMAWDDVLLEWYHNICSSHYNDVIISTKASQITSLTIVYSTVYSRPRSKKTSKLRVTGLCERNSPVTSEFPIQRASNAEDVSIWLHHYELPQKNTREWFWQNTLWLIIFSIHSLHLNWNPYLPWIQPL